jgi:glucodextranase-like protein/PASTA domain-containing protein
MPKFSALIVLVLAFLAVPALAAADPTATQITTPVSPAFVTFDSEQPSSLHVAGTTSGGTGNVDLRCYYGTKGPVVASGVPVVNGSFSTDVPVTGALITALGSDPEPYCVLRAVPTGTVPAAQPGQASPWQGPSIGWGQHKPQRLGSGYGSTPPATLYDYFLSRAQSGAMNDFDSISSCGLCDTYLFAPGTKAVSNPIWWSNAAVFANPTGVTDRGGLEVDGANAYSGYSAYYSTAVGNDLADNPGFPAVSESHSIDPLTGDVTINESAPYAVCAEDRLVFPPTASSCASFADSGVRYDRTIRQTDSGHTVTIVDHWKSVDGKAHELDAIYEDEEWSTNSGIAGRGGRLNFTWTQDGFKGYAAGTQIALPPSVPASVLVKTDATTPALGDSMNPVGSVTYGTKPSAIDVRKAGDGVYGGTWQARYQRTIPAGGEISIAVAYTHDFTLSSVQSLQQTAQAAIAAPSVNIDAPADGATVDAASAHVTGTASSPDGQATVKVNGVAAAVAADGHWSADVPLSDGTNQILAVASNKLGVTANAIVSVTRPVAPAPAATPDSTPAATTVVAAAKPVRCVVPKLRGKSLAKAKKLLRHAHCRLGKVSRKATERVKPGRVVTTRFKPGSRHRAGTRVRVTVAQAVRRV